MSEVSQVLSEVYKTRIEESELYANFEKRYRERGLVKASEFLWGSINKIACAIGRLYGKKLGKHKEIVLFMKDLAESKSKPEVIDWIKSAEALHSNFYHNWMEEDTFEYNARKAVTLRNWLIDILDEEVEKMKRKIF